MATLKRTSSGTGMASRTAALTAAWKRAFDDRIREAALTRAIPVRVSSKSGASARDGQRRDQDQRS